MDAAIEQQKPADHCRRVLPLKSLLPDQKLTRKRLIRPLTSPFRLLSTSRWPWKYSTPISANGTGFQIRFTSELISSLLRPQLPAPENFAAPEHTNPSPPPRLLMSWCRMPALMFDRRVGVHQCW